MSLFLKYPLSFVNQIPLLSIVFKEIVGQKHDYSAFAGV